jgi:hypothetical protein
MSPGRDYGDCRATLYPMTRALRHILLKKKKEKKKGKIGKTERNKRKYAAHQDSKY